MKARKNNKKAVSLMISYVLLIGITLLVATGVYIWVKSYANINPATDCNEDTSVVLEEAICTNQLELVFRNNGRFSVDGVFVSVGDDEEIVPVTYLYPADFFAGSQEGNYIFEQRLKPNAVDRAVFSKRVRGGDIQFSEIKIVQFQPFIYEGKNKIICSNAIIKQPINNCMLV